ncbi:hypothetical protein SAMN04488097_1674 [Epilithonimonas lactis]|nr:hypothetical protein SAMN04488097_1674 [Epilithonimonas lactis]
MAIKLKSMKKILFVSLLFGQLLSAQSYISSSNDVGNDLLKNIIIPLLIMIILFSFIFSLIAYFEGNNKNEDYSHKSINSELWALLVALIVLVSGLFYLLYINKLNLYLAVIPIKIIVASFVSYYANKKNRNPVLWWFLGFFEYHSALIVLALSKGLLSTKKNDNEVDSSYNEKLVRLNEMFKENLINENEFSKKKLEAENEYKIKHLVIKNDDKVQRKNQLISKLEVAFKEGLLTEEEYHNKLLKYKFIHDEGELDEEKEKFRRFHLEGMITFEEMQKKLEHIDNYRKSKQ